MSASTEVVMDALAHSWRSGAPSYHGMPNPAGAQAVTYANDRRGGVAPPSAWPSCGGITCTNTPAYAAGRTGVL